MLRNNSSDPYVYPGSSVLINKFDIRDQVDWALVDQQEYTQASVVGFLHADYSAMESVFKNIVQICVLEFRSLV